MWTAKRWSSNKFCGIYHLCLYPTQVVMDIILFLFDTHRSYFASVSFLQGVLINENIVVSEYSKQTEVVDA